MCCQDIRQSRGVLAHQTAKVDAASSVEAELVKLCQRSKRSPAGTNGLHEVIVQQTRGRTFTIGQMGRVYYQGKPQSEIFAEIHFNESSFRLFLCSNGTFVGSTSETSGNFSTDAGFK